MERARRCPEPCLFDDDIPALPQHLTVLVTTAEAHIHPDRQHERHGKNALGYADQLPNVGFFEKHCALPIVLNQ